MLRTLRYATAAQAALPLLLNLYYFVKPVIPRSTRYALRHFSAKPIRLAAASTWPIDHVASTVPDGWPGWPDGKSFAMVLTHDVERCRGLDRCLPLAEMEMSLGVRSSFNFVPEGEYRTPDTLRFYLTKHGFEVGVHDLHHDGLLYRSRKHFEKDARRINTYLRSWNAVGFRSGFMRHNLEWLKDLDVLYDSSTFDTDPFEPQPDGARTIFPFYVSRGDGSGYVELPYTLAQDSTLFIVLREQRNDIWKTKLDWVAAHGGMALLNVHPDYLTFDASPRPRAEYRAGLYQDFLEYALSRYGNTAWFALPRDVARHVRATLPSEASTRTAITGRERGKLALSL